MRNELVIKASESDAVIALLQEGRLMELVKEDGDQAYSVGDIYLGTVRKLAQSLNAAFVDVGYEKDAFLHYHDLGPQYMSGKAFYEKVIKGKQNTKIAKSDLLPHIDKNGSIDKVLKSGDQILVQIAKEPISTKGPRITTDISLAGRFMVLVPFSDRVSVSQKIRDRKEKERLRKLAKKIRPNGFGMILRTVAKNMSAEDIQADLDDLVNKWKNLHRQLRGAKPRKCVLREVDRLNAYLRDIMSDSFEKIVVDNAELTGEIREYVETIAPGKGKIVQTHSSEVPIFQHYNVDRQTKSAFGRTVNMGKGTYLIVEHTEAMHVIDVNSGNRSNKNESQEDNAIAVNLIAADEVARQLRLRDMGGIICIDFIDMQRSENRRKLVKHLSDAMAKDRARHKILPPSKFGIVEITRQRVRPVQQIQTKEKNPDLMVDAPITMIDALEHKFDKIVASRLSKGKEGPIFLHVHPFIHAFLTQGWWWETIERKWSKTYGMKLTIIPRDAFKMLDYRFQDSKQHLLN